MSRDRARLLAPPALAAVVVTSTSCSRRSPYMFRPHGPEAKSVAGVWWLMFAMATAVYVVVAGFVVVAALRGRRRGEDEPDDVGDRGRWNPSEDAWVWVGGIIVPVVILAVLAVVTVRTTQHLRNSHPDELRIEVTGRRWWWDVNYPAEGFRTANEIHVPVGRPVDVDILSDDVLHSFWVPQLAGKVDMVPGQRNHLRFSVSDPGVYRGECAEFCGIQHAHMDFLVVADPAPEFDRWLARRASPAGIAPTSEQTARGELVFTRESCAGCHAIKGTPADARVGPDLSDFGSRRTIGAATLPNTPGNLAGWISDSQTMKHGNLMPPVALAPDDLNALVTYLEGLK